MKLVTKEEIFEIMYEEMPWRIEPKDKIKPYILEAMKIHAHNEVVRSKAPEMLKELKHLVTALKAIHSFGATKPIIEHAEQLIKEATEL
jgi:isocitrate lyase